MASQVLTIRVPPSLVERLERFARDNFDSKSYIVRQAIERVLKESDHADR